MDAACKGIVTDPMQRVAEKEQMDADLLREFIATGKVIIPDNRNHPDWEFMQSNFPPAADFVFNLAGSKAPVWL